MPTGKKYGDYQVVPQNDLSFSRSVTVIVGFIFTIVFKYMKPKVSRSF